MSCVMVPLLADQLELLKYGEYKNEDDDKDKNDNKSSILLKELFFIKIKYMDYRQGLKRKLCKKETILTKQGLGRIRQVLDNFYHHHNYTASS